MKLPSKLYSYAESIFYYFPHVLCAIPQQGISVTDLYQRCDVAVGITITDYIDVLDCLYTLGKIKFKHGEIVVC